MFTLQKSKRERLTHICIRQAMLPHNMGEQACTFSEDSLRFDCRIAAKRPPYTSPTTAVNTSHPAQPTVQQPCKGERAGERGIEYVIKCSRAS